MTTELKHTPGPWKIYDAACGLDYYPGVEAANTSKSIVVFGTGADDLAGIRGDSRTERIANAKLIAAAPEMAEMLRELRNAIRYGEKVPQASMDARITGLLTKAGF